MTFLFTKKGPSPEIAPDFDADPVQCFVFHVPLIKLLTQKAGPQRHAVKHALPLFLPILLPHGRFIGSGS